MEPAGLTAEFFAELLGLPVVAVDAERIGTGLVGMNVRCALEYGGDVPADAPRSLVAKLPSPDEDSRAAGIATRTYEREAKFYAQVAGSVRIRMPRCWLAEWDEATGDTTLILEDLAPAAQGDQIAGCSLAQADDALRELARLHAPRWDDPALEDLDWLSRYRTADDVAQLQAFYVMCLPSFVATYARHLNADQLDLAQRFGERLAEWAGGRQPPYTVTHGDYRIDNMLFATSPDDAPVAVVDWQTPGHGVASSDLAYFLGASIPTEQRREHERGLVERYRAYLLAEGVDEPGADELWDQYRHDAFAGVVMTVIASTIVGSSDRSEAMFTAMGTRHLQHALDLDSWSLINMP